MIIALIIIISLLVGVGLGGVHVRKQIYNDIKRLEDSKITDGQFRDIVVNTYVTYAKIKLK